MDFLDFSDTEFSENPLQGIVWVCSRYVYFIKEKRNIKETRKFFAKKFLKNPFQKVHKVRIGAEVFNFYKKRLSPAFF